MHAVVEALLPRRMCLLSLAFVAFSTFFGGVSSEIRVWGCWGLWVCRAGPWPGVALVARGWGQALVVLKGSSVYRLEHGGFDLMGQGLV